MGRRGVVANDNRGFVGAVHWVVRTGLPWRDLPPHLGQWHRVFVRFSRWRTSGLWAQVLATLQAASQRVLSPRQRQVQPDSTTVRAHQHAVGARKKGPQALGRSRGGFSTKLHGAGDGAGGLLAFALTAKSTWPGCSNWLMSTL